MFLVAAIISVKQVSRIKLIKYLSTSTDKRETWLNLLLIGLINHSSCSLDLRQHFKYKYVNKGT